MRTATAEALRRCIAGPATFRKQGADPLRADLDWCRFGIRDPSPLMEPDGKPVADSAGMLRLFFNARDRATGDGGATCVGVARGSSTVGWTLERTPAFACGAYAAQGSVLRLAPDHFRMYYSPDTRRGFALASSSDGQVWRQFGKELILEPHPFGVQRMGLPYVRRWLDHWVMLFEGIEKGRFHIYLAYSADGITWKPGNRGQPIYLPAPDSWDRLGQANPSLYMECRENGQHSFFILYNGCSELHAWDVGILVAENLEGPWLPAAAPVLCRGGNSAWDAGRLEGARLIERVGVQAEIVYFGLPSADSYAGGGIAFASLPVAVEEDSAQREEIDLGAAAERNFNDKLATKYFDIWDNYPIQRFMTEIESNLMAAVIPPSARVLLLGSGGGRELPVLLNTNCQVTAVDIAPQMLAVGRARYPGQEVCWIEADLHELPPHLANFDAAVCLGAVFNYLRDPELFLVNARNALKLGASLILGIINSEHPSEKKESARFPDGRVRQLYSFARISEFLTAAGFELVTARGIRFFVDMLPPQWNQGTVGEDAPAKLLRDLLTLEARLTDYLLPEQGKFILIHAVLRPVERAGTGDG